MATAQVVSGGTKPNRMMVATRDVHGGKQLDRMSLCRLYCNADPAFEVDGLELLDEIGRGGMGSVYRARQTRLDRLVAVKLIARELFDDPAARARFAREARLLAKLDHPGVVRILDWGQTDEHCYLVME